MILALGEPPGEPLLRLFTWCPAWLDFLHDHHCHFNYNLVDAGGMPPAIA